MNHLKTGKDKSTNSPAAPSIDDLNEAALKKLIDQKFDLNAPVNRAGKTYLIQAAEAGKTDIVRLLIENHADVNIADKKDRQTALLLACREGHEEIVKILIANKADVHHVKKSDITTLMYAARGGSPAIVELLIQQGAKINLSNDEGQNALMYAADSDSKLEAFKLLVEAGADINHCDQEGKPAIAWSAGLGSLEITRYLIAKGADLSFVDSFGSNLLNYAKKAKRNGKEIVRLVKAQGIKNLPFCYGFNLAFNCQQCGSPVIVNGPLQKVKCASCQTIIELNDDFWTEVIGTASNEGGFSLVIGGNSKNVNSLDIKYRKMNPVCPSCKTGLDASTIPGDGSGKIPCPRCKTLIPYFPSPDWFVDYQIRGKHPVQIIGATGFELSESSEDRSAMKTIAVACISCNAALRVNQETPRNATCDHCGTVQFMPDALWLSLHPAQKRDWWYIRLG